MADGSIYISYSWATDDRNDTVNKMLASFESRNIEVKRDTTEMGYGDPIRSYMDKLAAGGAILLVLSKEYFQSPNCMYELREIYLNTSTIFRDKVFPIVLDGTKFHRAIDRVGYISYWEKERTKLKDALGSIDMENMGQVSHKELKDYSSFARLIDELQAILADINHWTEAAHSGEKFESLVNKVIAANSTEPIPNEYCYSNIDTLSKVSAVISTNSIYNLPQKMIEEMYRDLENINDDKAGFANYLWVIIYHEYCNRHSPPKKRSDISTSRTIKAIKYSLSTDEAKLISKVHFYTDIRKKLNIAAGST